MTHRNSSCKWLYVFIATLVLVMVLAVASTYAIELVPAGKAIVTSPKSSARGMDISNDESTLYIGGIQDRSLVKLGITDGKVETVSLTEIDPGAYGKAVWVDSNGKVWAPLTIPVLAVYSADLKLEAWYDLKPYGLGTVEGATVAPNGDIYVTDRKSGATAGIYKFRVEQGKLTLVKSWGKNGFVAQSDLRVPILTPNGDLLVNVWGKDEVWLVKAEDGAKSLLYKGILAPYFIAQDAEGRLWVVHYDKSQALSVYNADGTLLRSWTAAEIGVTSETAGVAVTKDGKRLYVIDQRNSAEGGSVLFFDVK